MKLTLARSWVELRTILTFCVLLLTPLAIAGYLVNKAVASEFTERAHKQLRLDSKNYALTLLERIQWRTSSAFSQKQPATMAHHIGSRPKLNL